MLVPDVHDGVLPNTRMNVGARGSGGRGGSAAWSLPFTVDNASILQWLDCIDGQYLKDRVGTGTDRILNGGPGLQQGRCYDFDGLDDKLDLGNTLVTTNDLSISVWVNVDSSGGDANGRFWDNGTLISIINGSTITIARDGATVASAATSILGAWHHVVITSTSTGVTNIYLDGVRIGAADQPAGTPAAGGTNDFIGNNSAGNRGFDGEMFGLVVYNDILTEDEISFLYDIGMTGVGDNPTLINAIVQYLMDEQSGTTAYDSSGNGHDAMLVGGVAHTTQDIHSWQNRFGYKLSGAVFLPKDYGAGGEVDINGDDLDYIGRAPFHGKLVNSFCGDFDGSDDYGDISSDADFDFGSGDWTISAWINADSLSSWMSVWTVGYPSSANGLILYLDSAGLLHPYKTGLDLGYHNTSLSTSTWHFLCMRRSGANLHCWVDGTKELVNGALSGNFGNSSGVVRIGSRSDGAAVFNGRICDVRVYTSALDDDEIDYIRTSAQEGSDPETDDLVGWWPLSEGAGTTAHDVTSNANHATLTNITAATFWSATQDKLAYSMRYGFRESSGVRIPARIGGEVAAEGSDITNPAGCWHNDAETEIDFNPFDIPELKTYQIGFDAYRTFNLREDEFKRPDQHWSHRETEIKIHHFALFNKQLTGSDRDNAWEYYAAIARLNAQCLAAWKMDEESATYLLDYTMEAVKGTYDLHDSTTASNTVTGADGNQIELYSGGDMSVQYSLGDRLAFAYSCYLDVHDITESFDGLNYDAGKIRIGFDGSGSGVIFFTYNGSTISSAATSATRYHVFAGIDDYGNMHLWIDGVWVAQHVGATMLPNTTTGQWSIGYGSGIMTSAGVDECYLFVGKRSRGMLCSQLYNGGKFISAGGVFS